LCFFSAALATGYYYAIVLGICDIAMICGVEKMTTLNTAGVTGALPVAADNIFELGMGIIFPGLFALITQEYFQKYGGGS
jgi:acetyl-CoA acetyltransferase